MRQRMAIVVFDIGKTNLKLSLVEGGKEMPQQA